MRLAKILAKKQHCIVGVTGESDYVTDGEKVIKSTPSCPFLMHSR